MDVPHNRIEEQERILNYVAKEIHDNLGSSLNLLMMNMQVIKEHSNNNAQKEAIENSSNIITQLIQDVNQVSHSINSNYIKSRGLPDALQSQLKYIETAKKINCTIKISGENNLLNAEEELLAFRIAQEAIHNTIKHAQATKLSVSLIYEQYTFSMTITDNGIGANAEKGRLKKGTGFMNMQERAQRLKGSLVIKTAPAQGYTISLLVNKSKDFPYTAPGQS